jgi:GNAT superfamily N-acetyltransferase
MIRQYQPEDAAACCRLIYACLEADPSLPCSLRDKMLRLETPQSMNERAKLFYISVYESGNQISGVAGLDMNEIRLLYVSPEQQHRGIGRALLDHLKSMAPAALFSDIFVYTTAQAAGFYKAYGFVEQGPYYFDLSGEILPAVFMRLSIR